MHPHRSMSFQLGSALALSLVLALGACGGTPAATSPLETDDVATLQPDLTDAATPTQPGGTVAGNIMGNGRPVDASVTIAGGSSNDGSYHAVGLSRICGNPMINITGELNVFVFDFPYEETPEIADIHFSADDLVSGTTDSFHVEVSVRPNGGNSPPALVIDTKEDGPAGHSGTAQRTDANGTTTLVVDAVDDLGATLHLTATCGPG
jgi:hypothetical protein